MNALNITPIQHVLDRLADHGCNPRQGAGGWSAKCPHGEGHKSGYDKAPSLSIAEGPDGKALLHCHTGCTVPDIARALGLGLIDLFPERPAVAHIAGGQRIKAVYPYHDPQGTVVFEVVRFHPKSFRQRRPDGHGGWIWNLGDVERHLYQRPQLERAKAEHRPIWIVEGEKDVENLQWQIAGAATCNSGGSKGWKREHTMQLAGATEIHIIHDDDAPGVAWARHIVSELRWCGNPALLTVHSPPASYGDTSDALAAGKTLADFPIVWDWSQPDAWLTGEPVAANEQQEAAEQEKRSDLLAQLLDWAEFWAHDHGSEEWIAWPLIPAGRQVALFAIAKTGKSIIALAVCAAIATGRSVFGAPAQPARSVLYLDYEMTPSDLQERLESLGYGPDDDLSNLHYALLPTLPPLNTIAGSKAVCELAALVDAEVVVIDTMGRAVEGEENSSDTYKDYARLAGIALRAAGRAVLRTDHAGKMKEQGQRGSSAKNDDVDVVLRLDAAEDGWLLVRTHSRIAWVPEKVLIRSTEDSEGRRIFTADRGSRGYAEGTKEVVELLRRHGFNGNETRRAVALRLAELGEKIKTKRLGDALAWMRAEDAHLLGGMAGTKPGTKILSEFGTTSGTNGTDSQTRWSDSGNQSGNHREPSAEVNGNQPRYVVTGGTQPDPSDPF